VIPDLTSLANSAITSFRQHPPWLDKIGAAAATEAVKLAWDQLKTKLFSPGAKEAIQKVESQPDKDRNWDTLKNHLLDALEQDTAFREQLAGFVKSQPIDQSIAGDGNKQAAVVGSPGSIISQ
jgi:hypothetical protein